MDGEVSSHSWPSAENGSAAAASPDYPDVSSPLESVGAKSPDAGEDYDGAVSSRGGSVIGSASRGSPPMSPVYKEDESEDDFNASSPNIPGSPDAERISNPPESPRSPAVNGDDTPRSPAANGDDTPRSPGNDDDVPKSPARIGDDVPKSPAGNGDDNASSSRSPLRSPPQSPKEPEDDGDEKSNAGDAKTASDDEEDAPKQRESAGSSDEGGGNEVIRRKRIVDSDDSDNEDASSRKNLLDSDDSDEEMDEEQRKKKLGNLIVNIFGEDVDDDAEEAASRGGEEEDEEDDERAEKRREHSQEYEDDYNDRRDDRDRSGGFEWDFDVMLREKKAEKKRKRKRRENGIDIINDDDGIIAHMVNAMKNAAKDDRHSNAERKPALKKRKMLHDVKMMLLRVEMLEAMIEGGMMSAVSEWLAPLPDKSLPALEIRTELLKILQGFGNLDQGVLKQSGLGRAVMLLYKHPRETKENKAMAAHIIREWSRPIFQLETNFSSVSREERVQRDLDHMSSIKKRRMSGEAGPSDAATPAKAQKEINRARVPRPSTKDYVVRPKSNVEGEFKGERKGKAFARLDKAQREFQERTKRLKAKRAVAVSLEGRNMAL